MFDLCAAVREQIHPIKILDVGGAISADASKVGYGRLLAKSLVEVVGFEPIEEERRRLEAIDSKGIHKYLPHAVGDGSMGIFHRGDRNATSSLLEPNHALIERFTNLTGSSRVSVASPIQTARLDDIREAKGADCIKLNVQGAEVEVMSSATEVLKSVVALETEVSFVPLYEHQPLFAEVDTAMRKAGFQFYRFSSLESQTLLPLRAKEPKPFRGQLLRAEAVYFRSLPTLAELSVRQLLKLAVIMDLAYGSRDFALLVLQIAEERGGPKLWDEYCKALTGAVQDRPS